MTRAEYFESFCDGEYCTFMLSNGTTVKGIVSAFFPEEPDTYYYVASGNMTLFKDYQERANYSAMKRLCVPIDISYISSVRRAEMPM